MSQRSLRKNAGRAFRKLDHTLGGRLGDGLAAAERLSGDQRARERALRGGTQPASRRWGIDRGKPLDRVYVEAFLERHRSDIRGRVLEIGGRYYTTTYGSNVSECVVYDVVDGSDVDIVGDLSTGAGLEDDSFDCLVILQTLMMIHDIQGAADTIHRVLKPGGVALVTVNFLAPNCDDPCHEMWQWNMTPNALTKLLADRFGAENVTVEPYGNYAVASSFLAGLAAHEFTGDIWLHEPGYEVVSSGRAVKAG